MKTCIYLRKSRADRDHQNEPLEAVLRNHEAILLAYAEKAGLDIVSIKKEVVSGESLARRPEMLRLLDEVEERLYDAVLVKDFDRLGRGNMMEQGIIIEAFRKTGTKIITPEKTYDLENEYDEESIDISAFFARKELKMITKRLHSGRMKSVSDGNYISPYAPYGYDRNHKTLTINERESAVVRLVFDLYTNYGYGDTKIAKYLTDCGIPNKHGNAVWDKTSIRNMIRNPVYIGKVTWNKREYRYQDNGKRTSRFLSPSEWKVFEGRHEGIIEEAVFERAQKAAANNSPPHLITAKTLRNPMANLMRCAACGAAMTTRTASGRADTLRCYRNCGNNMSSYLSSVENRLVGLLLLYLSNVEIPFEYMDSNRKEDEEQIVFMRTLENCKAREKRLKVQMDSLHDLLEQGIYDRNTFMERSKIISQKLELVESSLTTVRKQLARRNDAKKSLPPEKDLCKFIKNIYWKLDAKNKNELLKSIIDTVVYIKPRGSKKNEFSLYITLRD